MEQGLWRTQELFRIGALESGGADQFSAVLDVALDGQGRIFVLDGPSHEIRLFDSTGAHVRTFAREGQGPGELAVASYFEWRNGEELWVGDQGNRRFQVFDTTGTPGPSYPYATGMYGWGDIWGNDGLLYSNVAPRGQVFSLRLVRRRLEGGVLEPLDTFPVPMPDPGSSVPIQIRRDGRTFSMQIPLPFQATVRTALDPSGGWWLSHPGPRYRIARTNFAGDTLFVIERPFNPIPVQARDIQRAAEGIGRNVDLPLEEIPATHPPVEKLVPLRDGRLLVRRQIAEGTAGYDIFDAQGRYLGELTWPGVDSFQLFDAKGEVIVGVEKDELGVPYVVGYRLAGAGATRSLP